MDEQVNKVCPTSFLAGQTFEVVELVGGLSKLAPPVIRMVASAPIDPRETAQDAPPEVPTAASAASIRRLPSTSGSRLRCGRVSESRGPTGRS